MDNDFIVAIIAFLGTIIGSAGGVYTSAKLTNYRIMKLEEKVDRHNGLVEQMIQVKMRLKRVEEACEVKGADEDE